jgi:predicted DNA-binding protein with PD1-like motif
VRLFPNEDIHWELRRVCKKHEVQMAAVLSGLGQLKQFQSGYYKEKVDYRPQEFRKPHELLCLTGNISNQEGEYNLHLHAVLGDEHKNAIGGHLIGGKVQVTNEIVLLKTDLKIERILEESTGLEGMFLQGEMMAT